MTNIKQNKLFSGIKEALDTNAPTLATFGSVLGVGLTIFFMHRAAKNAAKVEEKYEEDVNDIQKAIGDIMDEEEAKEEKAYVKLTKYMKLVYIYRWALLSGIGSAGFAVLSNYLNGRTIAAITGLLALNNEKLKEYAKKGKEMLGEEKFKELQENVEKEIFGERSKNNKIKVEKSKFVTADTDEPEDGYERYYDCFWGEVYEMPVGRLKDSICEAERMEYLNFNDWRGMNGIESAQAGHNFCWDRNNPFKVHIGYVNVGVTGMKAIVYDNEPSFDKMGK